MSLPDRVVFTSSIPWEVGLVRDIDLDELAGHGFRALRLRITADTRFLEIDFLKDAPEVVAKPPDQE